MGRILLAFGGVGILGLASWAIQTQPHELVMSWFIGAIIVAVIIEYVLEAAGER